MSEPERCPAGCCGRCVRTPVVEEDLADGAGWVGVDPAGELMVVDLDEQAIRAMTPEVVGRRLVDAIGRAEGRARARRRTPAT